MISAAIKGTDAASGIDLTQLSAAGKSGGANFQKIMSKSLSSNVNNKAAQNMTQTKTASDVKSTSAQQTTKQVSAQDNTAASTVKKTADNSRSAVSDNSDKLTDAGEKIKDFLKEKLGVTDEELEKAMADLGLCMQDLLQPANLTDLVVELTGVEDAVAIITDAGLSETLTDVIDYAKQLVSDVQAGRELTPVPAEAVQTEDTAQTAVQENTTAMAAPSAEEVQPQEEAQDNTAAESTSALEDVLKSKLTLEGTENKTSDSGTGKQENAQTQTQTKAEAVNEIAGNLSQNIQDVFANAVQETAQVNPVEVVRQVVDAVKVIQKESLQSIEVQLNPENLGKLHITVSARNGVLTAEIATQNEQVKRAVESQMSMLKENLESQGIKVDAVEITVQSHAFEGGQNLQGNNSQQEKAGKEGKRHLDLSSLDELSDDELSEDEAAAKNAVMNENSSVEYTA